VDPGVIKAAGGLRQVLFADLHYQLVDFNKVDLLDFRVAGQFADDAAVTGSDDQHLFDTGVNCHRDMGNHLMIDEFVLFGQHHVTVQCQKTSELGGIKDVDALKLAPAAVQLAVHPNGQFNVWGL